MPQGSVVEQRLESRDVVRRRDQEDIADPGSEQRRQRVVDHGFVVHRLELFARHPGQRVEPGSRAPARTIPFIVAPSAAATSLLGAVPVDRVWSRSSKSCCGCQPSDRSFDESTA